MDPLAIVCAFLFAMAGVGWFAAYSEREKSKWWQGEATAAREQLREALDRQGALFERLPEVMSPWLAAAHQAAERRVHGSAERRVVEMTAETEKQVKAKLIERGHPPQEADAIIQEYKAKLAAGAT